MLTDVHIPFLGTPLVPFKIEVEIYPQISLTSESCSDVNRKA